ncbi:zinc finger protein 235 [Lingula anatina]|uniref:Zinc finger protein 235 n=1 Tax=Lingula anatina TaxID=7574 RepID=A0A1S3H0L9_LINAN|nr:zinc finger protein 235 [Lingula anatina]XP_013379483.1 zinc finger protein 235 [Lingula anatina]XP_013379484.1 zinc finger protein 235 [Lingula anatina]|eukprot:XP_013379482.1 zinc finger protein 235 [Lingula anatina]
MGKDSVFHCCGECSGLFGSKRVLLDHKLSCTGKPLHSGCVMVAVERIDYKKYKHYVEVYGNIDPAQIPPEPISVDPEQFTVSSIKLDEDIKVVLIDPFKGNLKNTTAKRAPFPSQNMSDTQRETMSAIESIVSDEANASFDIFSSAQSVVQTNVDDSTSGQRTQQASLSPKNIGDGIIGEDDTLTNVNDGQCFIENDEDDDDDVGKGDGNKKTHSEILDRGQVESGNEKNVTSEMNAKTSDNGQNVEDKTPDSVFRSKRQRARQKGSKKKKTKTREEKDEQAGNNDKEIDPENQSWGAKELAKYIAKAKEMDKLSDIELMEKYGSKSEGNKDLPQCDHLKCDLCDYTSAKKGHFLRHLRSHLTFSCDLCEYQTCKLREVKLHIARHEKPHMCEFCPYKAGNLRDLERHRWIHTDETPYHCEQCGYKCRQLRMLREHNRKHTGEYLICDFEGCTFSTPYSAAMLSHKQRHTDDKQFACTECLYRTSDRSSFQKHIKIHQNKKDYKCTQCSYRAVTKSSVSKHYQAVHEKMKLYQCDQCNYGSTTSSALRMHLMSHMNMKPFMCSLCSYRSISKGKIQRHLTTTHKDQVGIVIFDSTIKLDEGMGKYRIPGTERRRVEVERDFSEVAPELCKKVDQGSAQQSPVIQVQNGENVIEYVCGNCQTSFDSVESFTEHVCPGLAGQIEGLMPVPDADEAVLVGTILSLGDVKYLPQK